jgi:hypothetical protein
VRAERLGALDDAEGREDRLGHWKCDLHDVRSDLADREHRRVERRLDVRRRGHEMQVGAETDSELTERPVRHRRAARVLHHGEQERGVGGRPGHRPGVVERGSQRPHTLRADSPVGGFQPDGAAVGGRDAYRSARVTADGKGNEAGGEGDRSAAARAAGYALRAPRVVAGPHPLVDGGNAPGELVGLGLPEHDGARVANPADGGRVGGGRIRSEHGRSIGRPDLRRVEEVLDGERDPREGALGTSAQVGLLAGERLLTRALRAQRHERSQPGIDLGDPSKQRVDHFDRRQRAAAIRGEQLVRRQPAEVGGRGQLIPY